MTTNNSGYPDDNPKTVLGVTKTPLHLVPPSAKYHLAAAFADGASKYGPYNWRDKTVSASVYMAAAQRHIDDWWDGENVSRDAGVHHLAHAMACMAIVLDAMSVGRLNDDRPTKGAASDLHEEYANKKEINDNLDKSPAIPYRYPSEFYRTPATAAAAGYGTAVVKRWVPDVQENVRPTTPDGYGKWGY